MINVDTPLHFVCGGLNRNTGRKCGAEAARLALVGCVHEHITPIFVCAGHDQIGVTNDGTCRTCSLAGHQCPLAETVGDVEDLDLRLIEGLAAANPDLGEQEVAREFWAANLHRIPDHLRTLRPAPAAPEEQA